MPLFAVASLAAMVMSGRPAWSIMMTQRDAPAPVFQWRQSDTDTRISPLTRNTLRRSSISTPAPTPRKLSATEPTTSGWLLRIQRLIS